MELSLALGNIISCKICRHDFHNRPVVQYVGVYLQLVLQLTVDAVIAGSVAVTVDYKIVQSVMFSLYALCNRTYSGLNLKVSYKSRIDETKLVSI